LDDTHYIDLGIHAIDTLPMQFKSL